MNDNTGQNPQDFDIPEHSAGIRMAAELLKTTEPFAVESVSKNRWYIGSAFALLIAALTGALAADPRL